jgi:hypothetical protein
MNTVHVNLPPDVIEQLSTFIPSWHVCSVGPVPFGETSRVHIVMEDLCVPTQEEAIETFDANLHRLCDLWHRPFEEDEWSERHAMIRNGN